MQIQKVDLVSFYIYPSLLSLFFTISTLPILFAFDFLTLALHEKNDLLQSSFYSFFFLLISLVLISFLLELFYYIARWCAVILTHVPRLSSIVIPGLVLFLMIAWPLLDYGKATENWDLEGIAWAILFTLAIFVGVGTLLYYWPNFLGFNSVYLLASALCGLLFYELFSNSHYLMSPLFFYKWLGLIFLTFAFYLNFHSRHKLDLCLTLEHYIIPKKIISIIKFLFFVSFLIFIATIFFIKFNSLSIELFFIFSFVFLFLLSRWLIFSKATTLNWLWQFNQILTFSQRLLFILVIFVGLAASTMNSIYKMNIESISTLVKSRGPSSVLLTVTGLFLDQDHDNNSLWPGQDPDDTNTCIRYNLPDLCSANKKKTPKHLLHPIRSHGKSHFVQTGAHQDILLITLGSNNPNQKMNLQLLSQISQKNDWQQKSILLPTNRAEDSLQGLMQGLDGFEVAQKKVKQSIISQFTEYGYRSVCIAINTSLEKNKDLFKGCQVLTTNENKKQTLKEFLQYQKKFKEKKNIVWIHININPNSKKESLQSNLQEILKIPGHSLLLHISKNSKIANIANIFTKKEFFQTNQQFQSFHHTLVLAAGGVVKNQTFPRIGIFHANQNTLNSQTLPFFPRIHYYLRDDKIFYYDAITGTQFD